MQPTQVAAVALGGALGAVTRYVTQTLLTTLIPTFPVGTTLVNVAGSFAIGVLLPLVDRWGAHARPFLVVGVLGGLTTMSSFAAEVTLLFDERRWLAAALHWAGGAVLCIAACALGLRWASPS